MCKHKMLIFFTEHRVPPESVTNVTADHAGLLIYIYYKSVCVGGEGHVCEWRGWGEGGGEGEGVEGKVVWCVHVSKCVSMWV